MALAVAAVAAAPNAESFTKAGFRAGTDQRAHRLHRFDPAREEPSVDRDLPPAFERQRRGLAVGHFRAGAEKARQCPFPGSGLWLPALSPREQPWVSRQVTDAPWRRTARWRIVEPMAPDERFCEIADKHARLMAVAETAGVRGLLLTTQPNFSWVTGGLTNRIDGSRESGNGALLFTVDGRRYLVANAIESPRLAAETLAGAGFESIEYGWTEERADPALPVRLAMEVAGGKIGCDVPLDGVRVLEQQIARIRAPLTPRELRRYRDLGRAVGSVIGHVARTVEVEASEQEVAGALTSALAPLQIRPVVLLVAADERIARFRHPPPTSARWSRRLLIATCAERDGLVVAASRLIQVTRPDDDLARRMRASAQTCAALLEATEAGATGARLFEVAVSAYAAAGFPGEERLHHQGGAIGYRAREWIAHPASSDVVTPPQAFAWNPTVTGTKIEESCLVDEDGRIETVTSSPGWPSIEVAIRGQRVPLPDVLVRD